MGKKQGTKSIKNAHKTPTDTATGETEEGCSTEENENSQPGKSKFAAKKKNRRSKKTENASKSLGGKNEKKSKHSSRRSEDIVTDSVQPKKRARFRTRKGKAVKVPGKFISGKAVVNIWDEEEETEEQGDTKTGKGKQPGKSVT